MAAFSLVLSHFATPAICLASDVRKTVQDSDPEAVLPPADQLPMALQSLGAKGEPLSNFVFLVDKSRRTLTVWESRFGLPHLVGAWPVDLGGRDGDKLFQGDLRTPEGIYFLQTTQDGRRVNFAKYGARIFTTDYPNPLDRANRKTGHGIWLHAVPDSTPLTRGSHGCVVVRNYVVEGLAQLVELQRTPVIIEDQTVYVPPARWVILRADPWLALRSHLAEQSESVPEVDGIQIFQQGPHFVYRWRQGARIRTVYAQKNADHYDWVGESSLWVPGQESSQPAHFSNWTN